MFVFFVPDHVGDVAEISVKNNCYKPENCLSFINMQNYPFKKTVNLNKSGLVHLLYLETARADVITGDATEARTSRKEGREKGGGGGVPP